MKKNYLDYRLTTLIILIIVSIYQLYSFIVVPNFADLFLVMTGNYLLIALGYLIIQLVLYKTMKKNNLTKGKLIAFITLKFVLLILFITRGGFIDLIINNAAFTYHSIIETVLKLLFLSVMIFDLGLFLVDNLKNKFKVKDKKINDKKLIIFTSVNFLIMLIIALISCFLGQVNTYLLLALLPYSVFLVIETVLFVINKNYFAANIIITLMKTGMFLLLVFSFPFYQSAIYLFSSLQSIFVILFHLVMMLDVIKGYVYYFKECSHITSLSLTNEPMKQNYEI